MCLNWSPWRSIQLCTLFSKLRITLLHVAAEISFMMFSTLCLRSLMHSWIFLYTFLLQYPQRKKSSGFRSGDRDQRFSSYLHRSTYGCLPTFVLILVFHFDPGCRLCCFSKPASNVHNTFTRWCSSNIDIFLKYSLCG